MPEFCKFHPDQHDVWYCYPIPAKLAHAFEGWLLCPDCRDKLREGDIKYFEEALDEQSGKRKTGRSNRWTGSGAPKREGDPDPDAE